MTDRGDEYVTLYDVEVGINSSSGKAISVKVNDEWKWIPLSLVNSIHRNPRVRGEDAIEVARWFVEKEGLDQ